MQTPTQGYIPSQGNPQPPQGHPPQDAPQMHYAPQAQMQPIPGGETRAQPQQPQTFKARSFQNGLCSCCSPCSTCCLGCWCPCILFGRTRSRLHKPDLKRSELPYCTGACCGYAAVAMLCPGWQCIFGWMQRGEVRARYDIEGNECTDFLSHWCCDCCV
jgi:Cys-rich protein (TIGR01571 family)